jgi:hypothetical protein
MIEGIKEEKEKARTFFLLLFSLNQADLQV